jgi:hypothetical protein
MHAHAPLGCWMHKITEFRKMGMDTCLRFERLCYYLHLAKNIIHFLRKKCLVEMKIHFQK